MTKVVLSICDVEFEFVCDLIPERGNSGQFDAYSHDLPPGQRGNAHAIGPFCTLKVPAWSAQGVYCLTRSGEIVYVGKTQDIARRWGSVGYGKIQARNCHQDGQSTNCKINAAALKAATGGIPLILWFHETAEFDQLERKIMVDYSPILNGRVGMPDRNTTPLQRAPEKRSNNMPPTTDDFRRALRELLRAAEERSEASIDVVSGDLHRIVGGYPSPSPRMPSCCNAMRSEMRQSDKELQAPPNGLGASLIIRYFMPR